MRTFDFTHFVFPASNEINWKMIIKHWRTHILL